MEFYHFDADYVRRLCDHDPMIEGHFWSYFGDLMLIKLRSRRVHAADIPDLIHETFARVYETLCKEGGLRRPECLGAFVNTTCNHVWQEYLRRRQFEPLPADFAERGGDDNPESDLMTSELRRDVNLALTELDPKDLLLLKKHFYEEEQNEKTSRDLGVTPDYLRVLFYRAKQNFKKRYSRRGRNKPKDDPNRPKKGPHKPKNDKKKDH